MVYKTETVFITCSWVDKDCQDTCPCNCAYTCTCFTFLMLFTSQYILVMKDCTCVCMVYTVEQKYTEYCSFFTESNHRSTLCWLLQKQELVMTLFFHRKYHSNGKVLCSTLNDQSCLQNSRRLKHWQINNYICKYLLTVDTWIFIRSVLIIWVQVTVDKNECHSAYYLKRWH